MTEPVDPSIEPVDPSTEPVGPSIDPVGLVRPGDVPGPVRVVVVVDDEPLVRQGLSLILGAEDDVEIVGEAADGAEALRVVRAARPQVVCMDVRMPGIDGIRATELLLHLPEPPKVLVVTTFEHDQHVHGPPGSCSSARPGRRWSGRCARSPTARACCSPTPCGTCCVPAPAPPGTTARR